MSRPRVVHDADGDALRPAPAPGTRIAIRSVLNLRDLGGWPTHGSGTVCRGQVYRSGALDELAEGDRAAFAALGVRSVYDLRTEAEQETWPDRVPPGVALESVDLFAGVADPMTEEVRAAGADPAEAAALLGGAEGPDVFERGYRALVSLPSARAALSRLYAGLAEEGRRPALVHCAVGKDRTGWAVAALLLFLGVPEELVMEEFLLSNRDLFPAGQPVLDAFRVPGGDLERPVPMVVLRPGYLRAAIAGMREEFGGTDGYFADGLGLDGQTRAALRAALVCMG